MENVDFIGDIHGHAEKLKRLLDKLGYKNVNNTYRHPLRKVLFVGDYIDRGPQIPETLEIVKGMVDNGQAVALMGNHEYNAICFNTKMSSGGYHRTHSIKNIHQHYQTLIQFQNRQEEYIKYIDWFKSLPIFYESKSFRAVHATWDMDHIEILASFLNNATISDLQLENLLQDEQISEAIDVTLKGKELELPKGEYFFDKDGYKRHEIRIKWWLNQKNKSYQELSVIPNLKMKNKLLVNQDSSYYDKSQKPVFFGHYWLKGEPNLHRGNICCLDYSVAKKGYLACYRFHGEEKLENDNFIYV